jgi:hypothetical protein
LAPDRLEAARRIFFSIRALEREGIPPSVANEVLGTFTLFLRSGRSFHAFLPLIKVQQTTAIQERLIRLAEEGKADPRVIDRTEQLIRELNGAPGFNLARILSAYATLQSLLTSRSKGGSTDASLLDSFDAFEAAFEVKVPPRRPK